MRRATVDDAAEIAVAHVASWKAAYRGLLPDQMLDSRSVTERQGRISNSWRTLAPEALSSSPPEPMLSPASLGSVPNVAPYPQNMTASCTRSTSTPTTGATESATASTTRRLLA